MPFQSHLDEARPLKRGIFEDFEIDDALSEGVMEEEEDRGVGSGVAIESDDDDTHGSDEEGAMGEEERHVSAMIENDGHDDHDREPTGRVFANRDVWGSGVAIESDDHDDHGRANGVFEDRGNLYSCTESSVNDWVDRTVFRVVLDEHGQPSGYERGLVVRWRPSGFADYRNGTGLRVPLWRVVYLSDEGRLDGDVSRRAPWRRTKSMLHHIRFLYAHRKSTLRSLNSSSAHASQFDARCAKLLPWSLTHHVDLQNHGRRPSLRALFATMLPPRPRTTWPSQKTLLGRNQQSQG